jgi:hypothetical protein
MTVISVASGIAKKNGAAPEGPRQGNQNMLNVTERKPKATLLKAVGSEFVTQSPEKRSADWLENEIAKAKSGVITQTVDLTPALARVLLSRNDGNRRISEALVMSYARDIASDGWAFNGEPIIVSHDGKMNDGQHRCGAVIAADKPITTILTLGIARETRTTLDQGRVRTSGDFLAMDGHQTANVLGAAASLYWQYQTFGVLARGSNQRPTKGEVLRSVEHNPDIEKSVAFCHRKGIGTVGGHSLLSFIHYAIWQRAGRLASDEFVKSLVDGVGLSAQNPILYARNRIIIERGKLRGNFKAELIFKAWNAHRKGETLRHIILTGNVLPKLEK